MCRRPEIYSPILDHAHTRIQITTPENTTLAADALSPMEECSVLLQLVLYNCYIIIITWMRRSQLTLLQIRTNYNNHYFRFTC